MLVGWGPSGRWFKSSRPDSRKPLQKRVAALQDLLQELHGTYTGEELVPGDSWSTVGPLTMSPSGRPPEALDPPIRPEPFRGELVASKVPSVASDILSRRSEPDAYGSSYLAR